MPAIAPDLAEKRAAAMALLEKTGMRRGTYFPPMLRALWALGIDAAPPHLGGFLGNALLFGGFFGTTWGLLMWFAFWSAHGLPISFALIGAVAAGLFFGVTMAAFYAYGKRKYQLPSWDDLAGCASKPE
jgi:hypothetical protein